MLKYLSGLVLLVCLLSGSATESLYAEEAAAEDTDGLEAYEPIDYKANGDIGVRFADAHSSLSMLGSLGLNQFNPHYLSGAFGLAIIDDESFLMLRLQPELSFGKIGVGLDFPIMYGLDDQSFRTTEYEGDEGILRFVRYLRYGRKRQDQIYVRVGDLNAVSLGAGFVMYRFNNSASFEKRRIGTSFDFHTEGGHGVEGMFSEFRSDAIFGIRPYLRPIALIEPGLPIISTLEIGVPVAIDRGEFATPSGKTLSMYGVDATLPIDLTSLLSVTPYLAFATVGISQRDPILDTYVRDNFGEDEFDPGSGTALGVNAVFRFPGSILTLAAKLERRWFGAYFSGSYFDPVYSANIFSSSEMLRMPASDSVNIGNHPTVKLLNPEPESGWFGALYGNIFGRLLVGGSLQIPDVLREISVPGTTATVNNGARLHVEVRADEMFPDFLLGARYDRNFITGVSDAFELDERSVINAVVARKVGDIFRLGLHYRWSYAEVDGKLEPTSMVFPYVSVTIGLGGAPRAADNQDEDQK